MEDSASSFVEAYTLGDLIQDLERDERVRARLDARPRPKTPSELLSFNQQAAYSSCDLWTKDEVRMIGIGRIELLCDREPGGIGITASKVRLLRAKLCEIKDGTRPNTQTATVWIWLLTFSPGDNALL